MHKNHFQTRFIWKTTDKRLMVAMKSTSVEDSTIPQKRFRRAVPHVSKMIPEKASTFGAAPRYADAFNTI